MNERFKGETLGEYISRIRSEKGYSQRKFAQLTGLSNATISRIEKGETLNPDPETIKQISKCLQIEDLNYKSKSRNISNSNITDKKEEKTSTEKVETQNLVNDLVKESFTKNHNFTNAKLKGMRLITLRLERNVTQKELGDVLGVDKATIAHYEGELSTPDVDALHKLADFFGVSIEYLIGIADYNASCYPKADRLSRKEEESCVVDNSEGDSNVIELKSEYVILAKELQDSCVDPNDIRAFLLLVNKYKK